MGTATAYTVAGLVSALNKIVVPAFNKKLEKLDQGLSKSIMKKYSITPAEIGNYPFAKFLEGLEEKKGSRVYQRPSDAYNMTIKNVEYDKGLELERVAFERAAAAAQASRPLAGLNIQQDQIDSFQTRSVDHPIEKAMTLLEAGDASTYGTCFDGQNLFDTTHDFSNAAGSQSNIQTGTGETATTIHADILSAIGLMQGFTWTDISGSHTRLLNPKVSQVDIVCAPLLFPIMLKLKNQDNISVSEGNMIKGYIRDIHVWPFSDGDDYYVIDASDDMYKPILFQEESRLEFTLPNLQSDAYKEEGLIRYGANYRGGFGYGAWWKAIMVTNT